MRLHRHAECASDWGSVFAQDVKDSRRDGWSHFSSPVQEGTGWVLFVKTTVLAAAVFKALA